ncbi:hypothetical protein IG631_09299 [Alternaria alternata]|nr:hypothetical protein IG631_09299 [Alternaria alternata]
MELEIISYSGSLSSAQGPAPASSSANDFLLPLRGVCFSRHPFLTPGLPPPITLLSCRTIVHSTLSINTRTSPQVPCPDNQTPPRLNSDLVSHCKIEKRARICALACCTNVFIHI